MVILEAGLNHWYHMDMNYRGIINMLVMCGCIGKSGGGWSHYVGGQEKLRPQTRWTALAFALDWARPPRHMNSTSFFYAHTDQWHYETVTVDELLSPTAPEGLWDGALIDYNIRRPSAWAGCHLPRSLKTNQLKIAQHARKGGREIKDFVARSLKFGKSECPARILTHRQTGRATCLSGAPTCFAYPERLMNISSNICWEQRTVFSARIRAGKAETGQPRPSWHDRAPEGKLDLLSRT